ncbi:hypothetical protein QBC32DRAFT_313146 [Pseudoneurospora amorphoporcata]|uniref:Uncharacterized protein n=1 Tax=Pseudoneurospora amorphoporcata TaxID=241081 RepID=A0AAN6SGC0_9PEZI|nr:hypothetical protein QBC32DRAFT_313146 [Pseudoneurospora amorphoporcata]
MESSRASESKDPAEVAPLRVPRSRTREQTPPPRDNSDGEDKVNDTNGADNAWVDVDEFFSAAPVTSPTRDGDPLPNIGMARLPAPEPSVEIEYHEYTAKTPGSDGSNKIPISLRSKGPKSNADLGGYYFRQVMTLLERKHQDIMFYEEVENHSIMHLDWASEVGDIQKTQASRNDKYQEGSGLASKMEWGRTMFFGDWLYTDNGQREYYMEIQIKHISGDDDQVIRNLGMNPNEVWIGMGMVKDTPIQGGDKRSLSSNSSKVSAAQPKKLLLSSLAGTHSGFPRSPSEERDNEELEDVATLTLTNMNRRRPLPTTPPTNTSSSTSSNDGDATPKTVHVGSEDTDLRDPAAAANSPPSSLWTPLKLSGRKTATSKSKQDIAAGPSTDQALLSPLLSFPHRFGSRSPKPGTDRPVGTGIPRSKPLVPHSTSFDSIDDEGDTIMSDDIVDEAGDNGEGENYEGDTTQSEIVIPGTPSRSPSPASSPIRYSPDSDKDQAAQSSISKENQNPRDHRHSSLAPGHDTLNCLCAPDLDGSFAARKKRSSIYTVRVVALSTEHSQNDNGFNGPPSSQRHATLLGHGGWVCPPFEERVAKWKADHGHLPLSCSAIPEHEKMQHNNPPQTRCRAMPVMFDWSVDDPPRYYGEPAPVWWELGDPCLEDVYWMVWQLLSGKQFIGFKRGTGFGFPRTHTSGDDALLERCPFKSPSGEAGVGSLVKGEEIRLREMSADKKEKQER